MRSSCSMRAFDWRTGGSVRRTRKPAILEVYHAAHTIDVNNSKGILTHVNHGVKRKQD